jgi:hypothetical protein
LCPVAIAVVARTRGLTTDNRTICVPISDYLNWLRVLSTTEMPQIDQCIGHQFHAVVALLDGLAPEPPPLAWVLPRQRPLDAIPSRLHGGMAPPLAPTRGTLALARMLLEVRHQARLAERLAVGLRLQAAIPVARGAWEPHPRQRRSPLPRLPPRGPPPGLRCMDRRSRQGSPPVAVVVHQRDDLFALRRRMAGRAQAVTTCWGHGVGALARQDAPIAWVRVRSRRHAGADSVGQGAVVGAPGADVVNRRSVACRLAVAVCEHGSTRPWPPGVQPPDTQGEAPVIAECALGSALG